MKNNTEALTCPQCGSANIDIVGETLAICKMCNSNIVIENEKKTYTRIEDLPNEYSCYRIIPEFDEKDFIRTAWINIFNESGPKEIYMKNFSEVKKNQMQVVSDLVEADITYRANAGYRIGDRYSNKYNYEAFSSHGIVRSVQYVLLKGDDFDEERFRKSLALADKENCVEKINSVPNEIEIPDSDYEWLLRIQKMGLESEIRAQCPGDIQTNLNYSIQRITDYNRILYTTEEYESTIMFNGEKYVFTAYPFGRCIINGNYIPSYDEFIDFNEKPETRENAPPRDYAKETEKAIWRKTRIPWFVSMTFLTVSIFVSLVSMFPIAVVLAYFAAMLSLVGSSIYTKLYKWKHEDQIKNGIRAEITLEKEKEEMKKELNEKQYRNECYMLLNQKLCSLGLKPASKNELYYMEEEEEELE